MKTKKHLILALLSLLFSIPLAQAQYGYGNGYGNNYYGRRGGSTIPRADEPEKKAEPLTADEIVANEMPKITETLELNEFEQAVVSTILTKYVQQSIELRLLELDPDKTREGLEKIRLNQKRELKEGLPPEKFEALVELQENRFKNNKKKKKKKAKKRNED